MAEVYTDSIPTGMYTLARMTNASAAGLPSERGTSHAGADAAAAVALVVLWSSGFVGARLGDEYHARPDTLVAWRLLVTAAILLTWWAIRRYRTRGAQRSLGWKVTGQHAVIGVLSQLLYLGGVFGGIAAGVPAGTAALIAAIQPLVVANASHWLLSERVNSRQRVGLWLGLAGVAIVVADDLAVAGAPLWAYLLPLGAMLALSAGSVLDRRWRPAGSAIETLTVHVTTAAILGVAGTLLFGELTPPSSAGFWWALAWTVVLAGFGGYGMYLVMLRTKGATYASVLLYLTPPTTLLWAWVMFGDGIGPRGLAGFAVCAVAVYLALGRRPQQPRRRATAGGDGMDSDAARSVS